MFNLPFNFGFQKVHSYEIQMDLSFILEQKQVSKLWVLENYNELREGKMSPLFPDHAHYLSKSGFSFTFLNAPVVESWIKERDSSLTLIILVPKSQNMQSKICQSYGEYHFGTEISVNNSNFSKKYGWQFDKIVLSITDFKNSRNIQKYKDCSLIQIEKIKYN